MLRRPTRSGELRACKGRWGERDKVTGESVRRTNKEERRGRGKREGFTSTYHNTTNNDLEVSFTDLLHARQLRPQGAPHVFACDGCLGDGETVSGGTGGWRRHNYTSHTTQHKQSGGEKERGEGREEERERERERGREGIVPH